MKVAFVFPGQGSQYVGMGKEFYDNFASARRIFDEANEALGFNLSNLCFNGSEKELLETINAQPAVLTVSIACLEVFREHEKISPWAVAGHSLGEYSALVAAGSLEFKDAVMLVRKRGEFMQEVGTKIRGGMAAIIGLEREKVERISKESKKFGTVQPANYNCPGQIVISGEEKGLKHAMELAKEVGARRVVPLQVSGPFHSDFMKRAGAKLQMELDKMNIDEPKVPVVANVSADFVRAPEEIREALINQVSHSVLWEDSILKLLAVGVNGFLEVGPGKVLSGLIKRINRDCQVMNVEDMGSLDTTLKSLEV